MPRQANSRRLKVALLVNMIAPYRVSMLEHLAENVDLTVLCGSEESNRSEWGDSAGRLSRAHVKKSWGRVLRFRDKEEDRIRYRYLQLTPGYLVDLVRLAPDVVITIEMGLRTMLAIAYAKFSGKPVWVWWGGTPHTESTIGGLRKTARRMIAKLVDRWISYGSTSTEYLLSLGIARQNITQIQNCVDERMFPQRPARITNAEPMILFAGHIIRRKGIDKLLEAAAAVRREGLKFSLLLAGDGPELAEMKELAHRLQLDNVIFEPAKRPEDMAAVYHRADCLIFPTLADVWGLVVNEAALCGLPVLCSRYAGCAAELVPGENIFDPCNAGEFQAALRRATTRRVTPCDPSRLLTSKQVAGLVLNDLAAISGPHGSLDIRYSESA